MAVEDAGAAHGADVTEGDEGDQAGGDEEADDDEGG